MSGYLVENYRRQAVLCCLYQPSRGRVPHIILVPCCGTETGSHNCIRTRGREIAYNVWKCMSDEALGNKYALVVKIQPHVFRKRGNTTAGTYASSIRPTPS